MPYVLGIDLGTSYFKAGLFDQEGRLRGLGRTAVDPRVQGPRVELPVALFWERLRGALAEALERAQAAPRDVAALSVSSQANTFLLLDGGGRPLTPLLLWSDRRVAEVPAALRRLWGTREALLRTGKDLIGPALAVCKALWFRDHQPELWSRARRFMTLPEYLVYSLTGRASVDSASAALLGLLDVQRRRWWEPALRVLEWDAEFLGLPLSPGSPAGALHARGHRLTGLPQGLAVTTGTLDHYAAALGAGAGLQAPYSASLGTVLALVAASKRYSPQPGGVVGEGVHRAPRYFRMVFDANGAVVLERYQRTRRPELSFAELSAAAERAPRGAEGLLALPEGHPLSEKEFFLGWTRGRHEIGHEVRAIMESVAAAMVRLRSTLAAPADAATVATGGGARSDAWMQLLSDVTGAPFLRAACPEPACLGAALLAAAGAGWFPSVLQAARAWTRCTRVFRPDPHAQAFYHTWVAEREQRLAALA